MAAGADRRRQLARAVAPVGADLGELDARKRRAGARLMPDSVRLAPDDDVVARLAGELERELVGHVAGGHQQRRLLAQQLRTRSCSALTVGSSPNWSSPTSAAAIAARMGAVGRVTVSERRSITSAIL